MADDGEGKKRKKTRKEKLAEQREFDRSLGLSKGIGVKYDKVADRHMDDDRYERELEFKRQQAEGKDAATTAATVGGGGQSSATFDAFMRMATGKQERSIADKINDTNRPTWDEYKKKNEDLLDMDGAALKKMAAYRAELDAEREASLNKRKTEGKDAKRKADAAISDSEDEKSGDGSSGSSDSEGEGKKKHKKKKHKVGVPLLMAPNAHFLL